MPNPTLVPQGTNFRTGIKTISPAWLQNGAGYRYMYSIGIQIDAVAEALRLGVVARMPGYGPAEALQYSGRDRQILRGEHEPDLAYIARLQQAYPTWRIAGNAQSVLGQVYAYFANSDPPVTTVRYVVNGQMPDGTRFADWWTLQNGEFSFFRANPNNWNWDNDWTQIRFWIIVELPKLAPWFWGDGHVWGGGQFWGFVNDDTLGARSVADVRALIGQWKAAGSHCWPDGGIIFCPDISVFDPANPPGSGMPDGTWGDPTNRNTAAVYISGV